MATNQYQLLQQGKLKDIIVYQSLCCYFIEHELCAMPMQSSPPWQTSGLRYTMPCNGPPLHNINQHFAAVEHKED